MTNDEIKYALKARCAVVAGGKKYERILSWRVSVDDYTNAFCSTLECVEDRYGVKFVKQFPAADVEFANRDDKQKASAARERVNKIDEYKRKYILHR